jgi:pyruvate kinase
VTEAVEHTDMMVRQVDELLLSSGRAREGDLAVIIAGTPSGTPGSTNAMHVHRVGDAINEIAPAYRRRRRSRLNRDRVSRGPGRAFRWPSRSRTAR